MRSYSTVHLDDNGADADRVKVTRFTDRGVEHIAIDLGPHARMIGTAETLRGWLAAAAAEVDDDDEGADVSKCSRCGAGTVPDPGHLCPTCGPPSWLPGAGGAQACARCGAYVVHLVAGLCPPCVSDARYDAERGIGAPR